MKINILKDQQQQKNRNVQTWEEKKDEQKKLN